ncbi:putative salivary secreted peptide [Frankliniella fusca]|uniref:Salivary secreted peptide n=1 Tax=Frankliniella fusca TaxID=407009 RepID=A0AAE1I1S2_9NEOP|nr:putative salivary secreted peptide [Frankliniella fusca]
MQRDQRSDASVSRDQQPRRHHVPPQPLPPRPGGLRAAAASIGNDDKALALPGDKIEDVSEVSEARAVSIFLNTSGGNLKAYIDQTLTFGGVYPDDRQVQSKQVYTSSTIFMVHQETHTFKTTATIHCIQVVDMQKDGKNAYVTLKSGGINQKKAEIKFQSQRGDKINYLVILWGQ